MSHTTFRLIEAAQFLNINKETLRRKAVIGEVPSAKVGRAWIFLEEDLVEYLRSLYATPASQGVTKRRNSAWHYKKEVVRGGFGSATMDTEYNKALGLPTKQKHSNYTIN